MNAPSTDLPHASAGRPGLTDPPQRPPRRSPTQLGPLAWLQARLQPGRQQAMPRSDYVRIDFRGSRRQGINPFKPTSWPQLDVNVGTFWGLVVLSLAYVHHSTAGCATPHHRCIPLAYNSRPCQSKRTLREALELLL